MDHMDRVSSKSLLFFILFLNIPFLLLAVEIQAIGMTHSLALLALGGGVCGGSLMCEFHLARV